MNSTFLPSLKTTLKNVTNALYLCSCCDVCHCWSSHQSCCIILRHIGDLNSTKHESTRLTDGSQAALETRAPELLYTSTVDGEQPQHGRELPDMGESEACEFTSPTQGNPATATAYNR